MEKALKNPFGKLDKSEQEAIELAYHQMNPHDFGEQLKQSERDSPEQTIITVEPNKCGGKPCIRGMRITVDDVLSYLAAGMTTEEILADFPYLTKEDILACLNYVERT